MDCQKMDLLNLSKGNFSWSERSEKGQLCVFCYFVAIFLTV